MTETYEKNQAKIISKTIYNQIGEKLLYQLFRATLIIGLPFCEIEYTNEYNETAKYTGGLTFSTGDGYNFIFVIGLTAADYYHVTIANDENNVIFDQDNVDCFELQNTLVNGYRQALKQTL